MMTLCPCVWGDVEMTWSHFLSHLGRETAVEDARHYGIMSNDATTFIQFLLFLILVILEACPTAPHHHEPKLFLFKGVQSFSAYKYAKM